MTADRFRCSTNARALAEPLDGTASTVRNWILLEQPGPWGYDAIPQSRLGPGLGHDLAQVADEAQARLILIRRPGRSRHPTHGKRRCFVGRSGPGEPWLEAATIDHPSDLMDVDLSPLLAGRPVGLGPSASEPLFLVCTNGRRDPCCAERGRPLARALANAFEDGAWECSHIGGDRFAGNLVCFPHGIYLGWVEPDEGVRMANDYTNGLIDLDHYRGRSCYPFPVQAIEASLRRRYDLRRIDDLRLLHHASLDDGLVVARFATPSGDTLEGSVRVTRTTEQQLTCRAPRPGHPLRFEPFGPP